eukprot:CAMPEP_0201985352 /NCGR_PEP_ID=MMETSP0904-20121228/86760_1 /ASSEMBLY_ACC=CAM_ASM_000553 /TAXON_ID=420261 /ORGANISM="Thalassiosira antarctica, Strain CCMP982" /LENGTH=242 /DNA_ID=CAMNT_0048538999 /DNA_START=103 /DNA_END=827 /DNA_ORIENTATION=+
MQLSIKALTIVVPCFNEEDALPTTIEKVGDLLDDLTQRGLCSDLSKVCFVDDGSRDATWEIIQQAADSNTRVSGIKLSRNRGHQLALLAGLLRVPGDVIISMDADLQDDLGAVEKMLEKSVCGKDIVYGVRSERTNDTLFKRFTAEQYYKLLALMGADVVYNHADYRLMSRRAISALREYEESNLFLRGIIPSMGFPSATVTYSRGERVAGESKYPLKKMLALALDGITSFTAIPLRLIAAL